MNDSIGGVVNIFLIIFFLVVIALYLAFNVNYQKAFNVKNRIIELYEEYNGNCLNDSNCKKEIEEYESSVGYGNITPQQTTNFCSSTLNGMNPVSEFRYCHRGIEVNQVSKSNEDDIVLEARKKCYFDIVTFVEIDIPVINNLLKLRMFQVTGQTKQITIKKDQECDNLAKSG